MSTTHGGNRHDGVTATTSGGAVWRVGETDEGKAHPFPWGSIQWLCDGQMFPDAQQTFGHVQINAGAKNPKHLHPNSDEMLYLLEGELDHSLGDEMYHLTPGMSIHIPQGVEHDARNTGDVLARMIVAYPTSDRRLEMREVGQE